MKKEKLAERLKKELGYCFTVKTCDDPQYDFGPYLEGRLNNNAILQLKVYQDDGYPYWFEILVWEENPLEELRWSDDCHAETVTKLIKAIKEQYNQLQKDFKYLGAKERWSNHDTSITSEAKDR